LIPASSLAALVFLALQVPVAAQTPERPTMGEFMGVNGHTIQFKPDLYKQVCRKVRDYHSLEWDVGKETDFPTKFPFARNGVHWGNVYGSWTKAGIEADVCVMFNNTPPDSWSDLPRDARTYGEAFAKAFGPSSAGKLVASVEIGNEPGDYSDEQYRSVFQAMAAGFRAGDPKLKVLTCNMTAGKSGRYEKSVECVKGLDALYDTLTIHTYAMADGWPTWRRSYPEDPKIEFLKTVEALIAWRNANAKGKDIWVTEFGWDASTKPRATTGDAAKWEGNVSDEKQAQYLVRAFLLFSAMDVQRAYLYFFNDSDEPSFHAASGITRNFDPKPSFHAVAHLRRSLADYRFDRAHTKKEGEAYVFEFLHETIPHKKIIVGWSPTGSGRAAEFDIALATGKVAYAERMPLAAGDAPRVSLRADTGKVSLPLEESPIYVWIDE
jgi:hypothetical protein